MKGYRYFIFILSVFIVWLNTPLSADEVNFSHEKNKNKEEFRLSNDQIQISILFEEEKMAGETIEASKEWLDKFHSALLILETDANFMVEILWSGWKAPKKIDNADNLIRLTKSNFTLKNYDLRELPQGGYELDFVLQGVGNPFEMLITYCLQPESFYLRRRIGIRETEGKGLHFLRWIWPCWGEISGDLSLLKSGGFGQPAALFVGEGGAFFGLEYPTAENILKMSSAGKVELRCGQEIGEKIHSSWVKSEWAVVGLSPNVYVKQWFWKYVDRIRVAPLKPYLLYNSWYDLRSPEMVKDPLRDMTEENVLRTVASFKERLIEERGLHLDAFVLDDGWDIYRSDWVMNPDQFPNGLAPVKKALEDMGTKLGIWLGPIGGYSYREQRVGWMKANGYEVVGDQMCVAGKLYHRLLKKRLVDFIRSEGVSYYKWDGIQFTCNEAGHGHLPDIYSRRAVMESVVDLCQSVRAENPDIFLNITSGTWLSPWWLKYANTIWMQGYDYGYSNVPSISRRDRAMTYRDSVLYDDLERFDFWFPIANLMTHGIIKGHLQLLGGELEPLEKFSHNALLYFARGISMWELYISPDYLTEEEWDILAQAIRWTKDRFSTLCSTEMIGGDPEQREAYGYVHFSGKKGLVAVRNPFIEPQTVRLHLSESLGLDGDAEGLVLERVYPTLWISPQVYAAGSSMEIPLQGYETAIYEIYPLEEATLPLLAGRIFDFSINNQKEIILTFYEGKEEARLLNPERMQEVKINNEIRPPGKLCLPATPLSRKVEDVSFEPVAEEDRPGLHVCFTLREPVQEATLAVLLEPEEEWLDKKDPVVIMTLDGVQQEPMTERKEGRWAWHMLEVEPGKHSVQIVISPSAEEKEWRGSASCWLICTVKEEGTKLSLAMKESLPPQRLMPLRPWGKGEFQKNIKLGKFKIEASLKGGMTK